MSETITRLRDIIEDRRLRPKPDSYTASLFAKGTAEIAKKVGEEAVEVVVAALREGEDRLVYEAADLVYHLLVLLADREVSWDDVEAELRRRFDKAGEEAS